MGMKKTEAEKFFVISKQLDNIACLRITSDGRDFIAENPLVAGGNSVFFVFSKEDLLFHKDKL